MKKSIILLLLMTMVFGVVACKGSQNENSSALESSFTTSSLGSSSLQESSSTEESSSLQENSSPQESSSVVEEELGKFYSLQEAYDNGWLTREELLSIAYYYYEEKFPSLGGRYGNEEIMDENYTPLTKTPATLDVEMDLEIRKAYVKGNIYRVDTMEIQAYCGTYGECIAVYIYDWGREYLDELDIEKVLDIQYIYPCIGPTIKIYRK